MWGIGLYLQNVPQIWTEWNEDADWNQKRKWKEDAFRQFAQWLRSQSGAVSPLRQSVPNRVGGQNGSQSDETIEVGTKKQVKIVRRTTKDVGKNKPRYWFRSSELDGNLMIQTYSRQPFINRGYCTENDWKQVDGVEEMNFSANIVMSKYGHWDFDFDTLPDFDPGWNDLVKQSDIPL
jgi:hypothetical protein